MGVVLGEVVGDAGDAGVDIGAAEILRGDDFAGGGFHQRGAAEEDGALAFHDDGFIGHGGDVGAAGGAAAHDDGDLSDALRGHLGLVEEDAAEMVAIGEDLVLVGEVGAAGIHEVEAGEAVLAGDVLRAEVLLDGDGEVGAALHRGVVADDDAFAAGDAADAGDDAG